MGSVEIPVQEVSTRASCCDPGAPCRSSSHLPILSSDTDEASQFYILAKHLTRPSIYKKIVAEMVGTFALVFAGCGAVVVNRISDGAVTHVGIAIVFGAIVMTMIYAVGHISGAHFNPAVTIAFASVKRFPWKEVPGYIVAQIVAATIASAMLRWILGMQGSLGVTVPRDGHLQSFAMEIILSYFLMFVIAAVATDSRAEGTMAGIAIGGTVLLDAMFGGPICGASMNPARTLGPAFVSGIYTGVWLYIVGPVIGTVTAIVTYEFIRCHDDEPVRKSVHGCCK